MSKIRQPKSPWQKYNKKKFEYSQQYYAWKRAAKEFGAGDSRTVEFSCQHAKMVRVHNEACHGVL